MVDQLSLQAGRVTVFQDVDDTTAFTVEVTKDGIPVDLSGSTWDDPDGLMTVDATDAVNGRLGLSCGVQTGNQDWRLQADGDTTWLQGTLVVGSTRHVGAGDGTIHVAVEDATITITAVVPTHDHSGAYAPPLVAPRAGWYVEPFVSDTSGTFSPADADLRVCPIYLPPASIDALVCQVTSAGTTGAVVRLGLYDLTDLSLIVDAGTVEAETTGFKEATFTAVDVAGGWYGIAVVSQGGATTTPTYKSARGVNPTAPRDGATQLFDPLRFGYRDLTGDASGALPDPLTIDSAAGIQCPIGAVRVA